MKVMLLCGSPHEKGCSAEILKIIQEKFNAADIETEVFWIGTEPISGCTACMACSKLGKCRIDDNVNIFSERMKACDALVIAAPVHFASAPGALISFLDRVFYTARLNRAAFAGKPAAVIVSARRMGTTSAIDVLNKYVTYMEMPLVSGRYWAAVHGRTSEEVRRDEEGVQTLKDIADNMIWLLRCLEAGRKTGIEMPEKGPLPKTHFIR